MTSTWSKSKNVREQGSVFDLNQKEIVEKVTSGNKNKTDTRGKKVNKGKKKSDKREQLFCPHLKHFLQIQDGEGENLPNVSFKLKEISVIAFSEVEIAKGQRLDIYSSILKGFAICVF